VNRYTVAAYARRRMAEEWRAVVGWEGLYEVSDQGRVYSHQSKRVLCPYPVGAGYLSLLLAQKPRHEKRYVHHLVAYAFLGRPPALGWDVNHKSGVKTDNRLQNLEWRTHQSNLQHASAWGLLAAGRRARKLTPEQVHEVRGVRATSDYVLAESLGVSRRVLWQIRERITYRDVD
jgi:hypothetical protein